MTGQAWLAYCAGLPGALVDQPFRMDPVTTVARHAGSRKWFGILMQKDGQVFVNLKCRPLEGAVLRGSFAGIRPAWHMNKDHWISVLLESDVPDALIHQLTRDSHRLTRPRGTQDR